jgi:hypothetical protein
VQESEASRAAFEAGRAARPEQLQALQLDAEEQRVVRGREALQREEGLLWAKENGRRRRRV